MASPLQREQQQHHHHHHHHHHHALAIPVPAQGHINPLMRFCKRLAAQEGFTITFVNIEPFHRRTAELNQLHHDDDDDDTDDQLDIRRAYIPFHELPESALRPDISLELYFDALQRLAPHFEELLRKLVRPEEDPPITCVISDLYMTGPTQGVADKFNIPRIAFHTASQSILLFSNYILEGTVSLEEVFEVVIKRKRMREHTFVEGLPGLPTLKNGDIMDYNENNMYFYNLNSLVLQEAKEKAHAIVVNSFEELEGPALKVHLGIPLYAIGPLVDPLERETRTSLWEEDKECMKWLDDQPCQSVLYISFGSYASLSKSQIEEILAGLLSSQQRFLWVFRASLVNDVSHSTFPIEHISKSHGKGYFVEWAPQIRILSHPSVCGFLTHCGWNSTIEAISQGVPMLCFPYFSDQLMDAKYIIEEWKVGLGFKVCMESGLVERNEVERVIQMLMEGEEGNVLHKNATYFKEASKQTLLVEGASSKNIKALIQSLR